MDFELRADPAFSLTMNWDLRFVTNTSFVECSHIAGVLTSAESPRLVSSPEDHYERPNRASCSAH